MIELHNHFMPSFGIDEMRPMLRPRDQWEWTGEQAHKSLAVLRICPYQFHVIDEGRFAVGVYVVPDGDGRGFVAAAFGWRAMRNWRGAWARAAIRHFRQTLPFTGYRELRAWVADDEPDHKAFAKHFGFAYDCGPAKGILHDGRDANLFLWRR